MVYRSILEERFWYLLHIGLAVIILSEIVIRKKVLIEIWRIIKQIGKFFWELIKLLVKPFRFLWKVLVKLVKFIGRHWKRISLYLLDLIAIATIFYFSITWKLEIWSIIPIIVSGIYLPIHHHKTIWKVIRFVAIDIIYNSIKSIAQSIKKVALFFWNIVVVIVNFLKSNFWKALKETTRWICAAGGGFMMYYGINLENYPFLTWIGLAVITISLIFTRKAILQLIWKTIISIAKSVFKNRAIISRLFGLAAVIFGLVKYFNLGASLVAILPLSIGGAFLLFAHWILHPQRFWNFLKRIPKFLSNILYTIWQTIKTFSIYIYDNFIRLVLLIIMLFALVYGVALLLTFINVNTDFLGLLRDVEGISTAAMVSVGAGLLLIFSVALILFRRELNKLRTGKSKVLFQLIKERWKK